MKFDQVSKDLLAGARFIERHGFPLDDPHPLRAVSRTLQRVWRNPFAYKPYTWRTPDHKKRYYAAASRFHSACGIDNMDLSPEEAIDSLVAAAFWEIP